MKKVLSEYYGNGNNRIARVLIETIGDEKNFYVDYSTTDLWMNPVTDPSMQEWPIDATVEKNTERDAEDFAEDFVLYNKPGP